MNQAICDCCKQVFNLNELVSSHETIFDDEFNFMCMKCLGEMYAAENEPTVAEMVLKKVEELNIIENMGYSYIKDEKEDYCLTLSFINSNRVYETVVLYKHECVDYIIDLLCEITE